MPDEVIIADDGSTADTQETISAFKKETRLHVINVWQEDKGFRLAAIRNKAIAVSSSEYIVQIDGDIVLQKNFIDNHVKQAKQNHFISGKNTI
jgi:glycosyltransferase involved in cell wall biosynthesis